MSPALFISLFQSTNPRLCNKLPSKSIFSSTGKVENKTNKSEANIWLCLIASHFLPSTIHSPSYLWSAAPLLVSPSPGASNFLPPPTHLSPRLRPPSRVGEVRRGVGNVEHFFARDLLLSVHVNFLSKLAHLLL